MKKSDLLAKAPKTTEKDDSEKSDGSSTNFGNPSAVTPTGSGPSPITALTNSTDESVQEKTVFNVGDTLVLTYISEPNNNIISIDMDIRQSKRHKKW